MGYVAELDGLRALAIVLVLLFHGGWSWMSGGYVGVSLFFTLSGFLVTGLLLDEFERHGRIDVGRFLLRRMRRLLPASLACLSAVAVLGAAGAFGSQPGLGRDITGATLQLANWFALAGDSSYAEQVLGAQSPLDHFWSLSIEEQLYWIWPFAVGLALKRARLVTSVVTATLVGFALAIWIAQAFGPDAAYWATPARAGEVLVGATLAVFIRLERPIRMPATRTIGAIGLIGLTVVLWAAITWPAVGGPAYNGVLPFFAIASGALIFAAQGGDRSSVLRSVLRMPPLVGLGKVSYGTYLYHWPVFLLVDRHLGRGVGGDATTFSIQVVITLAVAWVSYRWLEQPIRHGVGRDRTVAAACATAMAVVLAIAALATFGPADRFADPPPAGDRLEPNYSVGHLEPLEPEVATTSDPRSSTTVEMSPRSPTTDSTAPADRQVLADVQLEAVPTRPVRVLVFGDSTAWTLGDGLVDWAEANPWLAHVDLAVSAGCGVITQGEIVEWAEDATLTDLTAKCLTLHENLPKIMETTAPDVVLIMVTASDLLDRVWAENEGSSSILDSESRARAMASYSDLGRRLSETGASTLWVKAPTPAVGSELLLDPLRTEALHGIIDETVASLGDRSAESIDLAAWYATSGMDDSVARADGLHLELDAAVEISERLIGPALVNLALRSAAS